MVSTMLNDFHIPHLTLTSPGAIAFHIGTLTIRWYGIFIAIAFLISFFIAENLIKKSNLNLDCFNDLIILILFCSIFFARAWFVFLSWDYYKNHLDETYKIWLGGQSIHGGMFGTILATFLFARIRKISFYSYMDIIAIVAPLGQAIGRWGNFFNNEAFGKPLREGILSTLSIIRLNIPIDYRPVQFINDKLFHPTFLYESFFNFILFIVLYKNYPLWKNKPGKTFWVYLLSYSIIRFFLEFIRTDSLYLFGLFPSAQVIAIIIALVSSLFLIKEGGEK